MSGDGFDDSLVVVGNEFKVSFVSDGGNNFWGYRFTATPSTEMVSAEMVGKNESRSGEKDIAREGASRLALVFKKWKSRITKKRSCTQSQ
mmetsp:Transcript_48879/g.56178  ORF Transcript_48879/g.56178 Transcript_48879/m.56178 type:complete len:90 (+) Transcript_48879:2-271(+)